MSYIVLRCFYADDFYSAGTISTGLQVVDTVKVRRGVRSMGTAMRVTYSGEKMGEEREGG